MSICRICLAEITTSEDYHSRCLKDLFGIARLPAIDLETSKSLIELRVNALINHPLDSPAFKKRMHKLLRGLAAAEDVE